MTEKIVIGVDGGGTSTRVALATATGVVRGFGQAGSGNFNDVGVLGIRRHIEQALEQAWNRSKTPRRQADAAFLGLASVASESDRLTVRGVADALSLAPAGHLRVDHDLRIALAGGLVGRPGIVLIVGTGSSCFGCAADGRTWRAGGWGPLLDDAGSSGWLGLHAMIAAVRDYDGRGSPTVLRQQVLDVLRLDDIQQLLHRVDGEGLTRRDRAALARLVTRAAGDGDAIAQNIIARGANELAMMVSAVAAKLNLTTDLPEIPVVMTGGLAKAGAVFVEPVRAAIQRVIPQCVLRRPVLTPVYGAVLLALISLGLEPTPEMIENLRRSAKVEEPHSEDPSLEYD